MRHLDRMESILQDRSDVWKVDSAMVFEYLDQKIATVICGPNPESNQFCHCSFFCFDRAWQKCPAEYASCSIQAGGRLLFQR